MSSCSLIASTASRYCMHSVRHQGVNRLHTISQGSNGDMRTFEDIHKLFLGTVSIRICFHGSKKPRLALYDFHAPKTPLCNDCSIITTPSTSHFPLRGGTICANGKLQQGKYQILSPGARKRAYITSIVRHLPLQACSIVCRRLTPQVSNRMHTIL